MPARTKRYTVIGYYGDGQRYCGHHNAGTVQSAVRQASRNGDGLQIVEVLEGYHMGLTTGLYVETAAGFKNE